MNVLEISSNNYIGKSLLSVIDILGENQSIEVFNSYVTSRDCLEMKDLVRFYPGKQTSFKGFNEFFSENGRVIIDK